MNLVLSNFFDLCRVSLSRDYKVTFIITTDVSDGCFKVPNLDEGKLEIVVDKVCCVSIGGEHSYTSITCKSYVIYDQNDMPLSRGRSEANMKCILSFANELTGSEDYLISNLILSTISLPD